MKPIIPLDHSAVSASRLLQTEVKSLICQVTGGDSTGPLAIADTRFGSDPSVMNRLRQKAASSPTSTAGTPALTATSLLDSLPILGPGQALGAILSKLIALEPTNALTTAIPEIITEPVGEFSAQGGSCPVRQLSFTSNSYEDHKIGSIFIARRELFLHSNAVPLVTEIVKTENAMAREKKLLDAVAGSSIRPAGLRYGISATPIVGVGASNESMIADLSALAASVSAVGGMDLFFIASMPLAIRAAMRRTAVALPFAVIGSSQLGDDTTVICIARNSVVVGGSLVPRLELSGEGAIMMDDSFTAGTLSVTGTPNVIYSPVISPFQTDSVATRIIASFSWLRRADAGVAWMTDVEW